MRIYGNANVEGLRKIMQNTIKLLYAVKMDSLSAVARAQRDVGILMAAKFMASTVYGSHFGRVV